MHPLSSTKCFLKNNGGIERHEKRKHSGGTPDEHQIIDLRTESSSDSYTKSSVSLPGISNFQINTSKKIDTILGKWTIQEIIDRHREHKLISRMRSPRCFDYLNCHQKANFLLILYDLLWRFCHSTPKDILEIIEEYLGTFRLPKDRLGNNDLQSSPGMRFFRREQLYLLGIHTQYWRPISCIQNVENTEVATSVLINGGSEVECDLGKAFIFVCSRNREQFSTETSFQDVEHFSLLNSYRLEVPIRVIRGPKSPLDYSPNIGFRYDGLYRIIEFFSDTGNDNKETFKCIFSSIDLIRYKVPAHDYMLELDPFLIQFHKQCSTYIRRNMNEKKKQFHKLQCRRVNVMYNKQFLFKIDIPYMIKDEKLEQPIIVTFFILLNSLIRAYNQYCRRNNLYPYWLEIVRRYSINSTSTRKPTWAKAGFLPFVLVINYKKAISEYTVSSSMDRKKIFLSTPKSELFENVTIRINKKMATMMVRPYFPQSDRQSIFTHIELCLPMSEDWSAWTDLSAGAETFPVRVVNQIDRDEPPCDFSYIRSSVFFSRLKLSSVFKCCPGCLPQDSNPNGESSLESTELQYTHCPGHQKELIQFFNCEFTCGDYCPCDPMKCTNRYRSGLQFSCEVVKTKLRSWELRTREFIPKGSYILQYAGNMIPRFLMEAQVHMTDKLGFFNYFIESVEYEGSPDDWIMPCTDSTFMGNAARFMNHSCSPNVTVKTVWGFSDFPLLCVISLKDINPSEALTYYYGHCYKKVKCYCGSPNCEGYIGKGVT